MSRCNLDDYRKKKDKITRRSPSVAEIKTEIRKQFKDRLQALRDNVLQKRRTLFEDSTMFELKEHLMETYDYPDDADLVTAFSEIEEEIKREFDLQQAQQHQDDLESEINSHLTKYVQKCSLCDNLTFAPITDGNVICLLCANDFFNCDKF